MDSKSAQMCLKTFLEVSKIQIENMDKTIKNKNNMKRFFDSSKKTVVNEEIDRLIEEREKTLGRLDSVRLEVLDILSSNPFLVSEEVIVKRRCGTALDLIEREKAKIEERGLYKKYPCSINEVLAVALNSQVGEDKISVSLFDLPRKEESVSDDMILSSVNQKNVKLMIKSM